MNSKRRCGHSASTNHQLLQPNTMWLYAKPPVSRQIHVVLYLWLHPCEEWQKRAPLHPLSLSTLGHWVRLPVCFPDWLFAVQPAKVPQITTPKRLAHFHLWGNGRVRNAVFNSPKYSSAVRKWWMDLECSGGIHICLQRHAAEQHGADIPPGDRVI